jgi:hypothetical protein
MIFLNKNHDKPGARLRDKGDDPFLSQKLTDKGTSDQCQKA